MAEIIFEHITIPRQLYRMLIEQAGAQGLKVYQSETGCRAFVSREPVALGGRDLRWHLSISHAKRLPTWQEIGAARDQLLPDDAFMCVPFPPRDYWLNLHDYCLHLWQFSDADLKEQFMHEGRVARAMGKGVPT